MHETLKPWGLNSAGVFSYLFLYMLILSLDNIAFAGVGSNQPAGHLKSCKVLVTRTNSYKLSSGPADKAHGNVSWAAKLHWPGDGLDNLVYIYPALIPVGLWPLQYPRSPGRCLTLPLPLVQQNWKDVWERKRERKALVASSSAGLLNSLILNKGDRFHW